MSDSHDDLMDAARLIQRDMQGLLSIATALRTLGMDPPADELYAVIELVQSSAETIKNAARAIQQERLDYSKKMVGGILNNLVAGTLTQKGQSDEHA